MFAAPSGTWERAQDTDLSASTVVQAERWTWKWQCRRCEVQWMSPAGGKDPDVCWLCGERAMSFVWTFGGKPWTYTNTEEAK